MGRLFRQAFTRPAPGGHQGETSTSATRSGDASLRFASIRVRPRDPNRFSPVFVLAPARSCSSVVATMIGQHPDLAGMPELKLFCCPTIGELAATLPRYWIERGKTHRSPGLVRALAEIEFGGQRPDALAAAQDWLDQRADWTGADVLDFLMSRLHPRAVVEKSPENVESDASLQRLWGAYPAARFIHLTRHPLATQQSMERHKRRMAPMIAPRGEPMAGVANWFEVHRRILTFSASLPVDRYLRIRAEDAVNDPDVQLVRIMHWLGVEASETAREAMKHPECSPFARPAPFDSGVSGGNDPGFLADPRLRAVELPQSLEAPPGWSLDVSVWRLVADLARDLGYQDLDGE
jgi:Sulfotransferase family